MTNNQTSEQIQSLIQNLDNYNLDTQLSAAYDLGVAKADVAVPRLTAILNDKDADLDLRWTAIESLGNISSPQVLSTLINYLEDETEDLNIRRAAINGLFKIDSGRSLLALLRFANNPGGDTFLQKQIKYQMAGNLQESLKQQFSFHELLKASQNKLASSARELISVVGNWQVVTPKTYGVAHLGDDDEISKHLEQEIVIDERPYKLFVEMNFNNEEGDRCYSFSLEPKDPTDRIPKGTRLRLLDEWGNAFENNEIEAGFDERRLVIEVAIESGEGIIWETEPLPDDYVAEPLYF